MADPQQVTLLFLHHVTTEVHKEQNKHDHIQSMWEVKSVHVTALCTSEEECSLTRTDFYL